jgi:hypothetical protein
VKASEPRVSSRRLTTLSEECDVDFKYPPEAEEFRAEIRAWW